MHKKVIGTAGSSSEAIDDHLAFNYFAPKDLLALPMVLADNSDITFSGLMVYHTTLEEGFVELGRISHGKESRVKRSIIMDDYVFSISDSLLKVNHLDELDQDIVDLNLNSSSCPNDIDNSCWDCMFDAPVAFAKCIDGNWYCEVGTIYAEHHCNDDDYPPCSLYAGEVCCDNQGNATSAICPSPSQAYCPDGSEPVFQCE
jgi:hypothetical protein